MALEHPTAGPEALEQGLIAAAGTTRPKEGTFGGTTPLMVPITTLTEETSGPYGVRWGVLVNSGALDGPCGPEGCWGSLRTTWWDLKSSCAPDVLEEPEGVLTESPTGIAYGTSVLFLSLLSSGLDDVLLMGSLMGPKSFLEGL